MSNMSEYEVQSLDELVYSALQLDESGGVVGHVLGVLDILPVMSDGSEKRTRKEPTMIGDPS